ncbi:MAG: hypothetical protein H7X95_04845, partial [Deltaproteobacteria bacterium]|nr:hypothetical protein [Deltaproteobacteria bacterium]
MIAARRFVGALALILALGGCAGTPWFLGEPLDGRPAIPPNSRAETVADHRLKLNQARERREKVIEFAELVALEQRGALHADDTRRLVELLKERARDWIALKRAIPLVEDLRHIIAIDPARARPLASALRNAARAAGDRWLALGENGRAEDEYRQAERLGAANMLFRLRAAWGASPADLEREVLERSLAELPERALAPFTAAYLDTAGTVTPRPDPAGDSAVSNGQAAADTAAMVAHSPKLIHRAWKAARVYGPVPLRARIEALPMAAGFTVDE